MKPIQRSRDHVLWICRAGLIAALYTVLTLFSAAFGLSGGVIQVRISEALCILPIFTTAAVPGLAVGCLVSNLLTGCIWQDVLFGTFATLLGALGAYALRRFPALSPLPTVLANTAIVPFVLAYAYRFEGGVWFFALTVGAGELISAYLFGILLWLALKPHAARLFGIVKKK